MTSLRLNACLQSLPKLGHDRSQPIHVEALPCLFERRLQLFHASKVPTTKLSLHLGPNAVVQGVQVWRATWPHLLIPEPVVEELLAEGESRPRSMRRCPVLLK